MKNMEMLKSEIEILMSKTAKEHQLLKAYSSGDKYYNDFIDCISRLKGSLKDSELKDILKNKLQLGRQKFNEDSYYQASTELTVIDLFHSIPHDDFFYEKPVEEGTKKAPECTIKSNQFTINVEAKSPSTPPESAIKDQQNSEIIVKHVGRNKKYKSFFEFLKSILENSNQNVNVSMKKNEENKLKDYLQNTNKKSPNYRDDNELNVLVVSLGDVHNMQEWYNYSFANEGLFTKNSFADPETYSRVSVVIFTNLLFRHKYHTRINGSAWEMNKAFNLLIRNPWAQREKENAYKFLMSFITNYTSEMKQYKGFTGDPEVDKALCLTPFVNYDLEKKQGIYLFEKKEV